MKICSPRVLIGKDEAFKKNLVAPSVVNKKLLRLKFVNGVLLLVEERKWLSAAV